MELLVMVGGVVVFLVIANWRRDFVIKSAPEGDILSELKRRAYERKLKIAADTEVENMVNRDAASGNIPY